MLAGNAAIEKALSPVLVTILVITVVHCIFRPDTRQSRLLFVTGSLFAIGEVLWGTGKHLFSYRYGHGIRIA